MIGTINIHNIVKHCILRLAQTYHALQYNAARDK